MLCALGARQGFGRPEDVDKKYQSYHSADLGAELGLLLRQLERIQSIAYCVLGVPRGPNRMGRGKSSEEQNLGL